MARSFIVLRRLAWLFAGACVLLGSAWLFRAPLLAACARTWVVDQPLTRSDAIVILGGRPDLRAPEAARLYHMGYASRILYMNVKPSPSTELGIIPTEEEQTRRLLLSNGVPDSAQTEIGNCVANTFDESRATRDWTVQSGAHSLIIATDLSQTRRALWIFQRELAGTGVQVHVHAIQPKEYTATNWWQHEEGLIAFQNEFLKDIYYHLKY